ncbi:MAG: ribosomal L7Ae/L30e/S12e/Gadd45 family protein [candidate division WOR-3 bacterium]|nr:ribosomal L7Ae/L30e/S12e/Gadd45 family protein [candidate division WOR-3 bacterium]MCX7947706.1 ribosomal L7Ae/L30e/S12e/Gadd45 family protein [candidate division WOR-3 bacterium]MDW8150583.1 ribosomal L7Ae/L30e/S12e/Gadd45 family protein [candidate division WOR-3 bacterium]
MEQILRFIRKTGKLKIGTMQTIKSIRNVKAIILAKDYAGKQKIIKLAKRLNIEIIILDMTKEELGKVFDRGEVGIISINDENLYKLFLKKRRESI